MEKTGARKEGMTQPLRIYTVNARIPNGKRRRIRTAARTRIRSWFRRPAWWVAFLPSGSSACTFVVGFPIRPTGYFGMGRPTGFEPATPRITILCSNQLSYGRRAEREKIPSGGSAVNTFLGPASDPR